ncbi:MAG: thioredoxin [Oscillospiraceae bacterium]|nr:thioredoxin [Oscillospiraceae bacterium]
MSVKTFTKQNFDTEISKGKVLVDFWAEWCGPCRMLSPVVDQIAEENADLSVGKVNVDEQPELAQRFGVMSIPTLLVFENGKLMETSVGVKAKPAILKMVGK